MSISDCVWMALKKANKGQVDLMQEWGIASRQAISNKFTRGSWSANELANLAEFTGGKLLIQYPDGQEIIIQPESKPKLKGRGIQPEEE